MVEYCRDESIAAVLFINGLILRYLVRSHVSVTGEAANKLQKSFKLSDYIVTPHSFHIVEITDKKMKGCEVSRAFGKICETFSLLGTLFERVDHHSS